MNTVPAVGGTHEVPGPDPVARDYLLLALRLDQRIPGLVDGYFGPADLKAQADTGQLRSPDALRGDAATLRERLDIEVAPADRRRWLEAQLIALETQAAALAGDALPYVEHVARCFDHAPVRRPETPFTEAAIELARLLPGAGSLVDRLAAWDDSLTVEPGRLPSVVDWLIELFRERARSLFGLPAGESLRVGLVRDQPWSGYNWFDGGGRSRVDINLDLPMRAADLVHTVAHETYPGHHLEHAWKEAGLVATVGRLEASVLLINTPECLVSEGLADVGLRFVVSPTDEAALLVELFERAGLDVAADPAHARDVAFRQAAISRLRTILSAVAVNASLMRHADGASHEDVQAYLETTALMTPERAAKRLSFIEHPLWRTYVFVYTEGRRLLEDWLDGLSPEMQAARFGRLLHEQLTPGAIVDELADELADEPPDEPPGAGAYEPAKAGAYEPADLGAAGSGSSSISKTARSSPSKS